MNDTIIKLIFEKLNIEPFQEFKIHGESIIYRINNELIVEFKHPIMNEWCIDKENYLSKLITNIKIINDDKHNVREQLLINKLKEKGYRYITRNNINNELQIFKSPPVKLESGWISYDKFLLKHNDFDLSNYPEFNNILQEDDFNFIKYDKEYFI